MSETEGAESIDFDEHFAETREKLGLDDESGDREEEEQQPTTAPDGRNVDWEQVWADVGADLDDDLSTTQLCGAIWASDATGSATDDGAGDMIRDAVDAGVLEESERKAPNGVIVTGGYRISGVQEVDDE